MHHLVISVAVAVVLTYIWWKWRHPLNTRLSSSQATKHRFSSNTTFRYRNGDHATLRDVYSNNVPSSSVFSPYNSQWFFDLSGLDETGRVIFSSSWHQSLTMRNSLPPFEKIKKWQINLGTSLARAVPADVWDGLRVE